MLGLEVDLSLAYLSKIVVRNTASRVKEVSEEILTVLAKNSLRPHQAAGLRGRFGFAYSYFLGRPLAPSLRQLSARSEQGGGVSELHPGLRHALSTLLQFVQEAPPRTMDFSSGRGTVRLFTDGAVESKLSSCGAVIFVEGRTEYFSFVVPKDLLQEWAALGSNHAVAQVELLPVILARQVWARYLSDAYVLLFIDNNSVLDALVKGNTSSEASLPMLAYAARMEMMLRCTTWVTRVPSSSNIADGPSRLDHRELLAICPEAQLVSAKLPSDFLQVTAR
jgi:hypothetical protein